MEEYLTLQEIADILKLDKSTIRKRLHRYADKGIIIENVDFRKAKGIILIKQSTIEKLYPKEV